MDKMIWCGYQWNTQQPWGQIHPGKPIQWYDSTAVEIQQDVLKLKTHFNPKPFKIDDQYVESPIGVGLICTEETFSFGIYEFQAKLPAGRNLWPALWLTATDAWPPEIDIMEAYSNQKGSYFDFNLKTPFSFWNLESNVHYKRNNNNESIGPRNGFVGFANIHNRYVTYKLVYTPNDISIYYDDYLVRKVTNKDIMHNVNQHDYYVIINNAVQDSVDIDSAHYSEFNVKYFKHIKL